jgi:MarC family membrane protein
MGTLFAITLTLFFVIDALGNIPVYLHLLNQYEKKKQWKIAIRELIFALAIMILFNYVGQGLLRLLDIRPATVQLAGGIVLFLIAIRLIFQHEEERIKWKDQEPFIVPLATPIIAGPSVLSIIMIFGSEFPNSPMMLSAILLAWFLSSIIFLCAKPIFRLVKEKGLDACQRLMGLIVALIAVQLFLQGISKALR